jgi:hypothetical protein
MKYYYLKPPTILLERIKEVNGKTYGIKKEDKKYKIISTMYNTDSSFFNSPTFSVNFNYFDFSNKILCFLNMRNNHKYIAWICQEIIINDNTLIRTK